MIIQNDGPKITDCDYWQTEHARAGYLYLSLNAGCHRLLVPPSQAAIVDEMRATQHIVITTLPLSRHRPRQLALEWMAEDGSDEPWACHLSPGQFDMIAKMSESARDWSAAVYVQSSDGGTELALEFTAYIRQALKLPCMQQYDVAGRPS